MDELATNQQFAAGIGQRFWSMVDKSGGPKACWPWTGSRRGNYGRFKLRPYVTVSAHRVAYVLGHGLPLGNLCACHECDNPPCCNPDHLFAGTDADNAADKMAKGRWATGDNKGAANGNAKLTGDDVAAIRDLIEARWTNTAIAARFGVTHQMISRIRRGRSWGEPAMQPRYASLRVVRAATDG